ncbi:MAG: 16S rRNA (uracil(1498)-N(3))-methyltransferase [Polaribacter sp.]|jgi:16S rRNA (uracil1498-N3)-methyltransferase
MQLFYNKDLVADSKEIRFDKIESRHIVKVLRKKNGDTLHITNGEGLLFIAEISTASDKNCVAQIIEVQTQDKPWTYYLNVAIAPTKSMDRLEWFLEKATEIGIDEVTPIITDNSERKVVKLERIEKIVISAAKQSLKYHLPKINDAIKLKDLIKGSFDGIKCIAHCYDEINKQALKSVEFTNNILILIGPEGDFSLNEVELSLANGFTSISLGESRLRTETAGIAAVHTISLLHQ